MFYLLFLQKKLYLQYAQYISNNQTCCYTR